MTQSEWMKAMVRRKKEKEKENVWDSDELRER